MRGSASGAPRRLGAALAAVAIVALAAWLLSGGHRALRPWLEGPEAGIRRALDAASAPPSISVGAAVGVGWTLRIDRLRFRDPLVTPRDAGAEVVAVADADGTLELPGRPVTVSYLGRERLALVPCPGEGWCVQGSRLPRLAALLAVLVRRVDAFDRGDAEPYRPLVADGYPGGKEELLRRLAADLAARPRARLRPLAWQVRIERETAQVGEDYEITVGDGPARRLRARLGLRDQGGRWTFTDGL